MKSLFFVVLGAIPLALLTISALGAMLMVRQWKPDITAENFSKIITIINTTEDAMRPLGDAPDKLATDSLLSSPVPQIMRGMPSDTPLWGNTADLSRTWGDLFFRTSRFMESQRKLESNKVADLINLQGDIRSFLGTLSPESEAENNVVKQLSALQRDVDAKIERLQKEEEAAQVLADARNAFDAKKWQVCARFCKQLQDEYGTYTATSVKAQISMMLNRCAFNLSEEGIELILDSDNVDNQKNKLASLLNRVKDPNELNDSQRRKYLQWKQQYDDLNGTTGENNTNNGTIEMDARTRTILKPYYDAPRSFAGKVQAAADIIAHNNDPAVGTALRGEIMQLINKGIPEKQCPESTFMRQAKLKDGTILKGFFKTVKNDAGEPIGFKYFDSLDKINDDSANSMMYKREDFSITPSPTPMRTIVAMYNRERSKLMKNINDPQAWSKFIAGCNQLETRRKAENMNEISFAGPIKAAELISDQKVQTQLQTVLK